MEQVIILKNSNAEDRAAVANVEADMVEEV